MSINQNYNNYDEKSPNQQDCYFFINDQCNRSNCPFRHSMAAKETEEICQNFLNREFCDGLCMKRHSTFKKKSKKSTLCYFNEKCTNRNCEYKHANEFSNSLNSNQQMNQSSIASHLEGLNVAKEQLDKDSKLSEKEKEELIDAVLDAIRKGKV